MDKLAKNIPILEWLPAYNKVNLKGDIGAGITVGIMLIPQGMAYAMLAGLPPIYGLYAAILPQLLYAILGTCRQLACLLYTSPSPRDATLSRMPSSA